MKLPRIVSILSLIVAIGLPTISSAQDVPAEAPVAPPVGAPEVLEAPDVVPPAKDEDDDLDGVKSTDPEEPTTETPDAPAPDVAPVAQPEPELSKPEPVAQPEPELSQPKPNVQPAPAKKAEPATTPDTDLAEAAEEGAPAGDKKKVKKPSTAERLASANPTVGGVQWSIPTSMSLSMSTATLSRGAQLSYNPNVSFSLGMTPRWVFKKVKGMSVGLRLGMSVELTKSEFTTTDREVWLNDPQLDLTYGFPWKPGGISLTGSANIRFPLGQISRGQRRFVGLGGRLLALKAFPVASGLIVGGVASYNGWITGGNGTFARGNNPYLCATVGGGNSSDCALGVTNQRHSGTGTIFVTLLPFAKFSINTSFTVQHNWGAGLEDVTFGADEGIITADGNDITLEDRSKTHLRTLTSFSFGIGYDFTTWLTGSLSYSTLAFHPDSDGSIENAFFNENTSLTIGIQIRPAAIYALTLLNKGDAEQDDEVDLH